MLEKPSKLLIYFMFCSTQVNCLQALFYPIVSIVCKKTANLNKNIFPNLGLYTLAGWLLVYNVFNLQNINKESLHKIRISMASIGLCGISLIAIYIGLVAPDKIFLLLQSIHSLDILVFDIHNIKERLIFVLGSLLSVLLMHDMPIILKIVSIVFVDVCSELEFANIGYIVSRMLIISLF